MSKYNNFRRFLDNSPDIKRYQKDYQNNNIFSYANQNQDSDSSVNRLQTGSTKNTAPFSGNKFTKNSDSELIRIQTKDINFGDNSIKRVRRNTNHDIKNFGDELNKTQSRHSEKKASGTDFSKMRKKSVNNDDNQHEVYDSWSRNSR